MFKKALRIIVSAVLVYKNVLVNAGRYISGVIAGTAYKTKKGY